MHNTRKTSFLLLVVMLLVLFRPALLYGESQSNDYETTLTATLDHEAARLGSIVALTIGYHLPEGARLPEKAEIKGLGGLTIVDQTVEHGNIKIRFVVDTLDVVKTDPLSLTYLDRDGNAQTLIADPVFVKVLSNLGDKPAEAQLKPIQDIIPTTAPWLKYLPWAAGIGGIFVLLAFVYWWKRHRQIQGLSAEVIEPPHLLAKKELESLLLQRLFEKGEIKRFYFTFSEILRRYVAAIRGFPAVELTTEEISMHINNDTDRAILPLLRSADLVKFADAMPTEAKKTDEVQNALAYIRETAPSQEAVHSGTSDEKSRRPRS